MAGVSLSGVGHSSGDGPARYAIYFVPRDDSALGRFGAGVLGRWPDGRPAPVHPGAPDGRAERTARAAVYGFHATIKAPFSLARGTDAASLGDALERFAAARAAVPLGELAVRHRDGSTVLACTSAPPALRALADATVRAFEPFRAPPDEAARARRRTERLDAAALERFERWGYPWVFDGFELHLTLAAGGVGSGPDGDRAWRDWIGRSWRDAAATPATLDRLALCVQARPDDHFTRAADHPLGAERPA